MYVLPGGKTQKIDILLHCSCSRNCLSYQLSTQLLNVMRHLFSIALETIACLLHACHWAMITERCLLMHDRSLFISIQIVLKKKCATPLRLSHLFPFKPLPAILVHDFTLCSCALAQVWFMLLMASCFAVNVLSF